MTISERAYSTYVKAREISGLDRKLVNIERQNARQIRVDGQAYICVCNNDYLALSQHEDVIRRSVEWTKKLGTGSGASRLVTGNHNLFSALESKLANVKQKQAALILASGFQANVSVLEALFDRKVLKSAPLVFSDKLNHASIHLGCRAAGLTQIRYRHCDTSHLAELLAKHTSNPEPKFILSESVFSMDGDIAPLQEIARLAKQHNALFILDDAHAAGVLGQGGSGLGEHADIVIGTFSKAYGAYGAYVASSQSVKDYLTNRCAGLIYSTALPPSILGAIDAALDVAANMDIQRQYLADLAETFRLGAQKLGYDTGISTTQIVPLIVGDPQSAQALSDHFKENGFWVTTIRPPTVPKGTARLRFAFNVSHTTKDIQKLLGLLETFEAKKPEKLSQHL